MTTWSSFLHSRLRTLYGYVDFGNVLPYIDKLDEIGPKIFPNHLSELARIIEVFAIGLIAKPREFALGIGLGLGSWSYTKVCVHLWAVIKGVPKEWVVSKSVRHEVLIDPIQEEIYFRYVIPKALEFLIKKAFTACQSREKKIEFLNIKLMGDGILMRGYTLTAKDISIFISSLLFAVLHNTPRWDLFLVKFPIGLVYGKVADSQGIVCTIAAHIIHNGAHCLDGTMAAYDGVVVSTSM